MCDRMLGIIIEWSNLPLTSVVRNRKGRYVENKNKIKTLSSPFF